MSITPDEIRTKPFLTERKGGYNRDEVVAFLDQVAAEFENLQSQFDNLETQPERDAADAEELDRLRTEAGDIDSLKAEMAGENEGRYGLFVSQVYSLADTNWAVFSMQTLTRTPEFRQGTI